MIWLYFILLPCFFSGLVLFVKLRMQESRKQELIMAFLYVLMILTFYLLMTNTRNQSPNVRGAQFVLGGLIAIISGVIIDRMPSGRK
jgi:hypothetical protein